MRSMPIEFTGIELIPATLRHSVLRSCSIIIVRRCKTSIEEGKLGAEVGSISYLWEGGHEGK